MKAAVFHRPGTPLAIEDISIDKPEPHEMLVRTVAAGAVSQQAHRLMLMAEPSPDACEIADEGYVNQATTPQRRAHQVEALYADPMGAAVASAPASAHFKTQPPLQGGANGDF
jgi:hypothetical protein